MTEAFCTVRFFPVSVRTKTAFTSEFVRNLSQRHHHCKRETGRDRCMELSSWFQVGALRRAVAGEFPASRKLLDNGSLYSVPERKKGSFSRIPPFS